MEQIIEVFSRNLKRIRQEHDLTQEALSEKCHYDRTYIGKIERGQKYPSLDVISRLSSVLEVPVVDFFVGPEDLHEVKYTAARKNKQDLDESVYQSIFASRFHFLVLFDGEGRVVKVNNDVLQCLGKEREAVEGTGFFEWPIWDSAGARRLKNDVLKLREGTMIREQLLVSLPGEEDSSSRIDLVLTPRSESREHIEYHVLEGFLGDSTDDNQASSPQRSDQNG